MRHTPDEQAFEITHSATAYGEVVGIEGHCVGSGQRSCGMTFVANNSRLEMSYAASGKYTRG